MKNKPVNIRAIEVCGLRSYQSLCDLLEGIYCTEFEGFIVIENPEKFVVGFISHKLSEFDYLVKRKRSIQ